MHHYFFGFRLLDGFVARALKANSNLGAQLDSLADMVSFGLLPGVTMFKALEGFGNQFMDFELAISVEIFRTFRGFIFMSQIGYFNLDEEQS